MKTAETRGDIGIASSPGIEFNRPTCERKTERKTKEETERARPGGGCRYSEKDPKGLGMVDSDDW